MFAIHTSEKILIVEDDADIRELIALLLQREGLEAVLVDNGESALQKMLETDFAACILDWMLPGLSGLEVMQQLTSTLKDARPPVLMLTARADNQDVISGLNTGADDYLTKPFDPEILVARVKSLIRRRLRLRSPQTLVCGPIRLNPKAQEAFVDHAKVSLTSSEFKILKALVEHKGSVLHRSKLIEKIHGSGIKVTERTIDFQIVGLRKKLSPYQDLIESVRSVGYKLNEPELRP